eukprot:1161352-Pelagomonas_calceolata.AAC.7
MPREWEYCKVENVRKAGMKVGTENALVQAMQAQACLKGLHKLPGVAPDIIQGHHAHQRLHSTSHKERLTDPKQDHR